MRRRFKTGVASAVIIIIAVAAQAQERPRVGLALAGGAARGFAHIGVLKVLQEVDMPVDVIVGTSMGAIIGGLTAVGYSATELESLALQQDWIPMIMRDVARDELGFEYKRWDERYLVSMGLDGYKIKLPSGLRSGQDVTNLLSRLTLHAQEIEDFRKLPIPFACVAMDITTGDAVVLDHGNLAEAMRASMAIPSMFTPIRVDGRLLTDGGSVRNLPASDVRDMGADIVIGVDVGERPHKEEELDSWIKIASQLILLTLNEETQRQYAYCDLVIAPDLEGLALTDFGQVQEMISRGEASARAVQAQLQELADSLNALGNAPRTYTREEITEVSIGNVVIDGLESISRRTVETELHLHMPGTLTPDDLERGIRRVYSTGYFERVMYRVDPYTPHATLHLKVAEKHGNMFRVGLRYDSQSKAKLLLNVTLRNVATHGSTLALDVIFGEEGSAEARYFMHTGLIRALGLRATAGVSRRSIDVFEEDSRVARYVSDLSFLEAGLGTIFATRLGVMAGIRGEYVDSKPSIGSDQFPYRVDRQIPIVGMLALDTMDDSFYPTRGLYVETSGMVTSKHFGSDLSFSTLFVDQRAIVPVARRWSILQYLYVGTSRGDDLPPTHEYFIGGVNTRFTYRGHYTSFIGLKAQESAGRNAQAFQLGVQWQPASSVFAILRWNVGGAFDEADIRLESGRYVNGGGLTIGYRMLKGRLEYTAATSERYDFLSHVTVGTDF